MSNLGISVENVNPYVDLPQALKDQLIYRPSICLVKAGKKDPNQEKIYQSKVWDAKAGKVMNRRLKLGASTMRESIPRDVAVRETVKWNQAQIELTEKGIAHQARTPFQENLDMPFSETLEVYLYLKTSGRQDWRAIKSLTRDARATFKHVEEGLPYIKTLGSVARAKNIQQQFDDWCETQLVKNGGRYKVSTISAWNVWFGSFLRCLQEAGYLPDEFRVKRHKKRPEDIKSSRRKPFTDEVMEIIPFIANTPIPTGLHRNHQLEDPRKLELAAAITQLFAFSGLRRETDVRGLTWGDVIPGDEANPSGYLRLHLKNAKRTCAGKSTRTWDRLPLLPQNWEALEKIRELTNPLNEETLIFASGSVEWWADRLPTWTRMYFEGVGREGCYSTPGCLRAHAGMIYDGLRFHNPYGGKRWSTAQVNAFMGNSESTRLRNYNVDAQEASAGLLVAMPDSGLLGNQHPFDSGQVIAGPFQQEA